MATSGALSRIVVGVDGSDESRYALIWAKRLASPDTVVEAVTAWSYPPTYDTLPWGMERWDPGADAAKMLEDAVDAAYGVERPPGLVTVVQEGHAAGVLLARSHDADMLIVGSRGHGGFAGMLLGSVSERCTAHSNGAVLVVHAPPGPAPTYPAG